MSFYSVQTPTNFSVFPGENPVFGSASKTPLSSIVRITTYAGENILDASADLSPSQIQAGQIFANPGANGRTYTLPASDDLIYFLQSVNSSQINQGDILSLSFVNLTNNTGTIAAGAGGSGSKVFAAKASSTSATTDVYIQYTQAADGLLGGSAYQLY